MPMDRWHVDCPETGRIRPVLKSPFHCCADNEALKASTGFA